MPDQKEKYVQLDEVIALTVKGMKKYMAELGLSPKE